MNNENKEIQDELAKLKKDAKVYLILTFTSAAFFGLLAINFLILSMNATSTFQRDNFLVGSTLCTTVALGFGAYFVFKMRDKQEKIKNFNKICVQIKT